MWINIFLDYHLSIFTEAFGKIAILKFSINCNLALLNNHLLQEQYYIHDFFLGVT